MINSRGKRPHRLLHSNLFGLFWTFMICMRECTETKSYYFNKEPSDFLELTHLIFKLQRHPLDTVCTPTARVHNFPADWSGSPEGLKANSPFCASSSSSPLHSSRKRLAPVKLPSPPITQRLVIPLRTRLRAACRRPSRVRKGLQRALPMTVPP